MSISKIIADQGRVDAEKFLYALWKRVWALKGDDGRVSQKKVNDYALWLNSTLHGTTSEAVKVVCCTLIKSVVNWDMVNNDRELLSCAEDSLYGLMELIGIWYDEDDDDVQH